MCACPVVLVREFSVAHWLATLWRNTPKVALRKGVWQVNIYGTLW